MADSKITFSDAFASLPMPAQRALDELFAEHPEFEQKFIDLVSRKATAMRLNDTSLLRKIAEEEGALFDAAFAKIST
jgi:hypothetical protein